MGRTSEAVPNTEMLIWARKSSAMPLEIAASKLNIDAERLRDWESGEQRPSIAQLRKIGNLYRRPIAAFYLPKAPDLPKRLRDLRLLPGLKDDIQWIELAWEERLARERRAIIIELLENQEETPIEFRHKADLTQNPEEVGSRVRDILGVTLEEQSALTTPHEIFKFWRNLIGNSGVLVFQAIDIPLTTARGFSIPDFPLPVIVANRNDAPRARVFTLIHELTHILLRIGGVCDMDYRDWRPPEEQRIEVFCNHVAGAVLVPKHNLLSIPLVMRNTTDVSWSEEDIVKLAKLFGVSREVIARRLLILDRVTPQFYEMCREQYQNEYQKAKHHQRQASGFPTPAGNAVSAAGHQYVSIVLDALYSDRITRNDVATYLGVRLKHLPRIERLVGYA